jgi:TRAP-type uncharacterized transport system substrate-binding protein
MSTTDIPLPDPELVAQQIEALYQELAALRRLHRAAQAAAAAKNARRQRLTLADKHREGMHAS